MKWSTWRSRHRILFGTATSAAAVALIAVGVPAAALATHPAFHAGPSQVGPGYPPPGGIYTPFTNCPLLNPIMQESTSGNATGCVAGEAANGSITLGTVTTPVVRPVDVQFGLWDPPNPFSGGDNPNSDSQFIGGILPPPAGLGAIIKTKPDLIPMAYDGAGLLHHHHPVVQEVCTQAEHYGGKYLDVYALAQNVGQLTNFDLFSWTQRIDFKLINPLLGSNCYVGSPNNPVVLNPQLTIAPGGEFIQEPDPNPVAHPNTAVLAITAAIATDNASPRPASPAAARVARRTSRSMRRSTPAPACPRRPGSTSSRSTAPSTSPTTTTRRTRRRSCCARSRPAARRLVLGKARADQGRRAAQAAPATRHPRRVTTLSNPRQYRGSASPGWRSLGHFRHPRSSA